ncbi:flagellar basal-body MS-ring/collar protein FliF [Rahnella laticis]|uniref:Flagellar M-ring protein n=1 Tax=Rahnella laticis TaxID=2787622 RepID=A0ABS0E2T2_9GAMM|nr:flagellar basal-body MS-ring/collar protein FliF [Rahnella laticis]MBF7978483.1 flagellar M-ring protein FliF [Rahnella laticis]MBF7998573.1 flagellar M-ring protein FliF [Rahnella sp. LAC-M12]
MLEQLKLKLSRLPVENLRKWGVLAGGAALVTALIVAVMWGSSPNYTALFGSQENIPVAQVVEVLSGEKIAYRIEPASGQILVAEGKLPQARMALAAKGIAALHPAGYELMDKEEMLGSSQFVQNVRFRRSLEGELAQSIMAIDAVGSARVHLGISEASSFVLSNRPQSSASVMVRLKYGQTLSAEQVGAIVNLVSGSVPGMDAANVRVVDQQGQLLSADLEDSSAVTGSKRIDERVQHIRQQTERNVANLLTSVVGAHNFRVSVVPQVDFSQIEETQERYLGEPRVNSESLQQENTTDEMAIGIPGSLSNRPANAAPAANTNPQGLTSRNQAQRQFAYDRDIRSVRHPGYKLEKLSVAVVLNEAAPALAGWNADKQTAMNQLLTNAVGIDAQRGDVLSLSLMNFAERDTFEEPVLKWWEKPAVMNWAERGGMGLLGLLVILFGILPLLRRVARRPEQPGVGNGLPEMLADGVFVDDTGEESKSGDEATLNNALPRSALQLDDNLPAQSSGLETKIEYLQMLAQSETDRVAEVIKQWISSNERSTSSTKSS